MKGKSQNNPSFLFSTFILGLSLMLVKVIGAFFKIPLMNLIGESGMASFSGGYTVFSAVYAVTASGLTTAASKIFSEYRQNHATSDLTRIQRLCIWLFGSIGLLGTVILLLGSKYFAEMIANPHAAPSIAAISFAILFCCLTSVLRGYHEGMGDMLPTAISQLTEAFGKLIFGLYGVINVYHHAGKQLQNGNPVFGTTVHTIEEAYAVAAPYASAAALLGVSIASLLGFLSLIPMKRRKRIKTISHACNVTPYIVLLKELGKAALPITVSTIIMQLFSVIDTLTVIPQLSVYYITHPNLRNDIQTILQTGETVPNFIFGIYCACITVANLLPAAAALISKTTLPQISMMHEKKEHMQIRRMLDVISICSLYYAVPVGCGMMVFAKPILQILYSHQPHTAAYGEIILAIFGAGAVFLAWVLPMSAALQAEKQFWCPVSCQLIGILVKVALQSVLIHLYGVYGAAIATVIAYGIIMIGIGICIWYRYPLKNTLSSSIKILLSAIFSCYTARCFWNYGMSKLNTPSILLALSIFIAVLCYLLCTILFHPLKKEELKMLLNGEKIIKVLEKIHIIR